MATPIQLVIDANDSGLLGRFWAEALHYVPQAPPDGSASWIDYWRTRGMSAEELAELEAEDVAFDIIVDPDGVGPRIWLQPVPEGKTTKNRLHLDLRASGGWQQAKAERIPLVDNEVERLQALGATIFARHDSEGMDHYAVTMQDPEGNEFCVN